MTIRIDYQTPPQSKRAPRRSVILASALLGEVAALSVWGMMAWVGPFFPATAAFPVLALAAELFDISDISYLLILCVGGPVLYAVYAAALTMQRFRLWAVLTIAFHLLTFIAVCRVRRVLLPPGWPQPFS